MAQQSWSIDSLSKAPYAHPHISYTARRLRPSKERDYGETAYILIATYRKRLGVTDDQYSRFKDLSFYAIKKPGEEINRVRDFM